MAGTFVYMNQRKSFEIHIFPQRRGKHILGIVDFVKGQQCVFKEKIIPSCFVYCVLFLEIIAVALSV